MLSWQPAAIDSSMISQLVLGLRSEVLLLETTACRSPEPSGFLVFTSHPGINHRSR